MALLATQAALLKERAAVLASLGLDDLHARGSALVSDVAKEARKRGTKRRAEAAPVQPVRRSLRSHGILTEDAPAIESTVAVLHPESARPEGDVTYQQILTTKSDPRVATQLLSILQENTQILLGLQPPPLEGAGGTSVEACGRAGRAAERSPSRGMSRRATKGSGSVRTDPVSNDSANAAAWSETRARPCTSLTSLSLTDPRHVMKVRCGDRPRELCPRCPLAE